MNGTSGTTALRPSTGGERRITLIDQLLADQRDASAVDRFVQAKERRGWGAAGLGNRYRSVLPARAPSVGEQYAFEVDLDKCSGCKACVTACHSLNGLEPGEAWRSVGLLVSAELPGAGSAPVHVTTACHHCEDPGCLSGCPVLAYDKDPVTGIVRHLDDQCIGCQYCVMKCPYEVPRYSDRLGIVRKCDMCSGRLAVGEAPACVQACPNQAISITLVRPAGEASHAGRAARAPHAGQGQVDGARGHSTDRWFLPDSPDPGITLPTTRYRSSRPMSASLRAADHDALRLERSHWSLTILLVLTQAAAGLSLVTAAVQATDGARGSRAGAILVAALILAGMAAAVFHLGQPSKAWRSFLGWRTSWLSRELIAFHLFIGSAALAIPLPAFTWPTAILGMIAVATSAMVYVDTRRPFWSGWLVFPNFYGTTLLLGACLGGVVFSWAGDLPSIKPAAVGALSVGAVLLAWRRYELNRARRESSSPIHWNVRVMDHLLSEPVRHAFWWWAAAMIFCGLAVLEFGGGAGVWVTLAAVAAGISELAARRLFFAAGGAKRMPGGVVA